MKKRHNEFYEQCRTCAAEVNCAYTHCIDCQAAHTVHMNGEEAEATGVLYVQCCECGQLPTEEEFEQNKCKFYKKGIEENA